ncbi:MAG: DUF3987 domain-containing protein [Betaproteobacteria bacterium]|nr:DUF3987 domain-containing protein [Betaproteobacteria bacterium]
MNVERERIESALSYVPAGDRDLWLRMGMAIKAELGEDGFPLWDEWSQRAENYRERDARTVWNSINGSGKVTAGTLYYEAKQRGWKPSGTALDQAEAQFTAHAKHVAAAERAGQILATASGEPKTHPYWCKKTVSLGARVKRGAWPQRGWTDALLVPIYQRDGKVWGIEAIDEAGDKDTLKDCRKGGGFYPFGKIRGASRVLIGEGVATVAAALTGDDAPGLAALTAGNLKAVAQWAREVLAPGADIIILADNDPKADGSNPGMKAALDAARAATGRVAIPELDGRACDFWDVWAERGHDAIQHALANAQAPVNSEAPGEWPQPQQLPEGLPVVAPFDLALLPETLQPWARDICERVQCPADYVGVTIMAALGSVIGRKAGIRAQERTDWTEYPNQWALCVGRPGVLKSPAMEAALSPLKRLAVQASEKHRVAIEEHQQTARLGKLKAEASEKAVREKLHKNPKADVSDDLIADTTAVPMLRRYIANDTSAESLGELLRQNLNGLLVFRDELVSLLKGLDREENAAARGFYLTGWAGNSAYTFDRIGRGLNLHIPAVCLSLLGSTQPGRIAEYLRAAVKGGAGDDGLIQRFGLLVWPDTGGTWRDVDRWPDSEARHKANAVFENLDGLDAEAIGAQQDDFGGARYVRFDDEGLGLFREWRGVLESKLRTGDLHPALESHLAKYRKLVPGLALILHLANGATGPVSKRATLQALAWAEYLETHARRAYASVTSPEVTAAKAIVYRLRRGDLNRTFSSRDVWRPNWANLSDRETVLDALRLLVDFDWIMVTRTETAGRTATVYEANPKGLKA